MVISRAIVAVVATLAVLLSDAAVSACQPSTPALAAMEAAAIRFEGPAGEAHTLSVKIAGDVRSRAAGFQSVCARTISTTAILFLFESASRPAFHMQNVYAALDIAFVDEDGVIRDIQTMQPYVLGIAKPNRIWRSSHMVNAAVEVAAGYFADRNIVDGSWKVKFPRAMATGGD